MAVRVRDAKPGETFIEALAGARMDGDHAFIDPETHALIGLDRQGNPGRYGMLVRELRLADQARDRVWWRRILKWIKG